MSTPNDEEPIQLTPSMIPNTPNFDVKDSSFFQNWNQLPSPDEVQAQAKTQDIAGMNPDKRRPLPTTPPYVRPPPVLFENMNLFVKWGTAVNLSEAWALYAINQLLKGRVSVPEVYGWRTHGNEKYIYMEYIRGKSLEEIWDMLDSNDRTAICHELRASFDHLRRLEQNPLDKFVGNIARAPLYDRSLNIGYMSEAGPFATVHDFHEWFTFLHRRPMPDPYSVPIEPFRHDLPDDCVIKFTHGDLHRSNIFVTPNRPHRVLAVVDWEQSGWLPVYWEVRKAQYTTSWGEEWSVRCLPMVLEQYSKTWEVWDYYTSAMGC